MELSQGRSPISKSKLLVNLHGGPLVFTPNPCSAKLNRSVSLHPWLVKCFVAKRDSFYICNYLLHIPCGRGKVQEEVRSECLSSLMSLESVQGALR